MPIAAGQIQDRARKVFSFSRDYEALQEAAIDPYVAVRDAYVKYRLKKVNRKGGNTPRKIQDYEEMNKKNYCKGSSLKMAG